MRRDPFASTARKRQTVKIMPTQGEENAGPGEETALTINGSEEAAEKGEETADPIGE